MLFHRTRLLLLVPTSVVLLAAMAWAAATRDQHWSFRKLTRSTVPAVKNRDWVRSPIDAFILSKLESRGLSPAPAASKQVLIRRAYFDLIGLPPQPGEVDAFLADSSPDAYEKLIDRLLASPHYGERWGRYWLDLVRFAETNGYERDGNKPNAWRFRDYVIKSFNEDKPYDRFVQEQLAGDELRPVSTDALIATAFHRLGSWDDEPADPEAYRYELLDDVIKTTSNVFLGVTLNCARCHDHKFDPFTQKDYYRMLAFFLPSKYDDNVVLADEQERRNFDVANRAVDDRQKPFQAALDVLREPYRLKLVEEKKLKLLPEVREALNTADEKRTDRQKALVAQYGREIAVGPGEIDRAMSDGDKKLRAELARKIGELNLGRPKAPETTLGIADASAKPPPTYTLKRGNPRTPGEEVQPGFPTVLTDEQPKIAPPDDRTTGRRLALARWITSPDNPLSARVIVNRVWQFHFGQGLARSPSDFGTMGEEPDHPELLDWLAGDFVAHGWHLKSLHKLVMTSSTYRQASAFNPTAAAADPENRLLWRMSPRRLEAEPIRDSILQTSGRLNPAMGGPSVFPKIDPRILAGQSVPGKGWGNSSERDASRRSVYIFVKRSVIVPMMEVLDFADTTDSCPRRNTSTVAPQALTMLNNDFLHQQARYFALRLLKEAGADPARQIELAYRLALSRRPTPDELQAAQNFLTKERSLLTAKPAGKPTTNPQNLDEQSLAAFCLVMFNLNEFVYVD